MPGIRALNYQNQRLISPKSVELSLVYLNKALNLVVRDLDTEISIYLTYIKSFTDEKNFSFVFVNPKDITSSIEFEIKNDELSTIFN